MVLWLKSGIIAIGKVGKNGELYPPKKIREKIRLKPGQKVIYIAKDDRIEVIPLKDFLEALKEEPVLEISFSEFEKLSEEVMPID